MNWKGRLLIVYTGSEAVYKDDFFSLKGERTQNYTMHFFINIYHLKHTATTIPFYDPYCNDECEKVHKPQRPIHLSGREMLILKTGGNNLLFGSSAINLK